MIANSDHDVQSQFRRGLAPRRETTAVSSRGLGHSPLKAGARVRIPYALPFFPWNSEGRLIFQHNHWQEDKKATGGIKVRDTELTVSMLQLASSVKD